MNDDNGRGINLGIEYNVTFGTSSDQWYHLSLSIFLREEQMMQRERKQRALYA